MRQPLSGESSFSSPTPSSSSPLLISEEGTIIPPLPSPLLLSSFFCHVSLFTEKEKTKTKQKKTNSSLFSPMHPEIHPPTPVYSLAITYQPSYLHFHLKKSTVLYIYIMIIPDFFSFFFTVNVFVLHPSSYSVVYWLLSCGMFVLSQSNVVFTLKPHFS